MRKLKLEELGRISVDQFRTVEKLPVCMLLDNVRSLHNVGSAFRTADAFKIEKIFLAGITGTPPHREIHKTALGATDSVPWHYDSEAAAVVQGLKNEGYTIVIVEQTTESIPLYKFNPTSTGRYCLVFGNEVNGVSESVIPFADAALEIPQEGTKHSLNISVCVGIVVWEIFKKIALARN